MTIALLGVGTELTRGDITNTNGAWLAKELTERGFEVTAIDVVDDNAARIKASLDRLARLHEAVICTGGLGPTTDDITTECVASLLSVELTLDELSLRAIEQRVASYGHQSSPSNRKQAYFPKGATIMPNHNGTAPGFSVALGHSKLFFMPGVPSEMKAMFLEQILPSLGTPKDRAPHEIVFHTFGVRESELNDRLDGLESAFGVTIGYRVRFPEIDVKVLAFDAQIEQARLLAEQAANAVRSKLQDCIYGEGDDTLPAALGKRLARIDGRLAIAESCTGGLISSLITEHPGVSSWFLGSVVSYDNRVKTDVLSVPFELLEKHGAVSSETALAMVKGVAELTGSDHAIAVTGIAGPSGATPEKPVGTVYIAIKTPSQMFCSRELILGERLRIQRVAAYRSLMLMLNELPAI